MAGAVARRRRYRGAAGRVHPERKRPGPGGWWRGALTGGLVGFALAMPLFECLLLTALALDGEIFRGRVVIGYLARPARVLATLALWHGAAALVGAGTGGWLAWRKARRRPRLRVIPGGTRRGCPPPRVG
ncbi:MAG: hypothetical protein DIU70_001420 [Bacillota bacterium]|nr:MAG: hypothetical protein DIU70_04825 [Bacillota bacterium]